MPHIHGVTPPLRRKGGCAHNMRLPTNFEYPKVVPGITGDFRKCQIIVTLRDKTPIADTAERWSDPPPLRYIYVHMEPFPSILEDRISSPPP
eukprot:1336652-Amorphochlora_amoeboformis.AAC.1